VTSPSNFASPNAPDGGTGGDGEELPNARLSEAAKRALAEAHERRQKAAPPRPLEVNGRNGPEPVRYGDWEVNGIASDF
jgi:hypothetical protein